MVQRLYDYFRSSAAYRVRIALHYKNISVEHLAINLKPGIDAQHSDDYKNINPQGRVPFFIEEGDNEEDNFQISQSPTILEYLEECYPNPALLPSSSKDKAKVRELCSLIACDVHPLNNLSVLKYLKSEFSADETAINKWYNFWIIEGFNAFESHLKNDGLSGKFCFGDIVTLADIYLIPQLYNARRFAVPLHAYPHILSIEEQCQKLPAFQNAAPENQADAKGL